MLTFITKGNYILEDDYEKNAYWYNVFFALGPVCLWGAEDKSITIRPYGAVGGTDVELRGANTWETTRSGGGFQGMFNAMPSLAIGGDIAFLHEYTVNGLAIEYVNMLFVAEYHWKYLILQFGVGPYFGVGYNDDIIFASMFGGGADIPVTDMLSVVLMARFDLAFENWWSGDDVVFMPGFMAGLSIKF